MTGLFALWKIAWASKDTTDPLISLSKHKLLGSHNKLRRCTNTQRHAQKCTRKHRRISTSKLVISVYWDTPHIINPSLVILSQRDECLHPQVKSISDYSNINVSDIFTFSLLLHKQISLETEPFRSLVYVSTTCTMHTRSCVIETLALWIHKACVCYADEGDRDLDQRIIKVYV